MRNFLVDCDGRVLLCDFGLTQFLPEGKDAFRKFLNHGLAWWISTCHFALNGWSVGGTRRQGRILYVSELWLSLVDSKTRYTVRFKRSRNWTRSHDKNTFLNCRFDLHGTSATRSLKHLWHTFAGRNVIFFCWTNATGACSSVISTRHCSDYRRTRTCNVRPWCLKGRLTDAIKLRQVRSNIREHCGIFVKHSMQGNALFDRLYGVWTNERFSYSNVEVIFLSPYSTVNVSLTVLDTWHA